MCSQFDATSRALGDASVWSVLLRPRKILRRPRKMTKDALRMAMAAMTDPKARACDVARRLGITTTTLYEYVNGDGSLKQSGQVVLDKDI